MGHIVYSVILTIIQSAMAIYLLATPKHLTRKLTKNEKEALKAVVVARICGIILIINCGITITELMSV